MKFHPEKKSIKRVDLKKFFFRFFFSCFNVYSPSFYKFIPRKWEMV